MKQQEVYIFNASAFPTVGGVENSIHQLALYYTKLDYKVIVVCFNSHTETQYSDELADYTIKRLQVSKFRWPHMRIKGHITRTEQFIEENLISLQTASLIISRYLPMSYALAKANRGFKLVSVLPTTVWFDCSAQYLSNGNGSNLESIKMRLLFLSHFFYAKKLEKFVLDKSRVVVFSQHMKEFFLKYYQAADVETCAPGVDYNIFNHSCAPNENAEFSKICEDESITILGVGRLSKAKNFDLLVNAIAYLEDNVKLLLAGDGPERKSLEDLVERLNLRSRVKFLGSVRSSLPMYYRQANCVVLPTRIESFGQVVIESLACGTPVVGFGGNKNFNTAIPEIIHPFENGLVCETFTPEALAKSIKSLLSVDIDRVKISEDCKKSYSWEKLGRFLLDAKS